MNRLERRDNGMVFGVILLLALPGGFFLRTCLLSGQVFLDDEWHGFYYALGKSPGWLFTHFSIPGATCIPLNVYIWLLGACGGWSETMLRLPSLVCGVLCVVVCPLLAWQIIGPRRAAWLALLLAISPILIFYSRLCRPYSAVAFLGLAALLLAERWRQTGGRRFAAGFAMTGVLAVYFHLYAVVTVAAPIIVAILFHLVARHGQTPRAGLTGTTLRQWLLLAAVMSLAGAGLVLPALIHSLHSTFFDIAFKGSFTMQSLPPLATLFSGTASPVLAALFGLVMLIGAVKLCRLNPWFGVTLVSLYPLHALALVLSRPDAAQSAIVLARYCIVLVPVTLLFVACGLEALLEWLAARIALRPALQTIMAAAGIAALAAAGPLPQTYLSTNNFTNHGAFQHRYAPIDWHRSFYSDITPPNYPLVTVIRLEEVSPFYGQLAKMPGGRPVIEYPMMIGDHFNPLYYYQHFHQRPVIAGYNSDVILGSGLAAGNIYGNTYIDQILSLVKNPEQLKFRNLISLDDLKAIRRRNVEFIILHKRFEAQLSQIAAPTPDLERLCREYREILGAPAYEDRAIIVFRP